MRWHVHGTDSLTGQDVELSLNEQEASRAVKTAIDHQIVVTRVTRAGNGWTGWIVAGAALVIAGGMVAFFQIQHRTMRQNLQQAIDEQSRLSRAVAMAEETVQNLREHGNLAAAASSQMNKLADDLAASRSRLSLTNQQLSDARNQMETLEQSAAMVPTLEKKLVALHEQLSDNQRELERVRKAADQSKMETALQSRRLEQLAQITPAAEAAARIGQLEKGNQGLSAQIEKLKAELLIAAAQPVPAAPVTEPAPVPAAPVALPISFDAARGFFALHVDPGTVASAASGNLFITRGIAPANALQLQYTHDRTKDHIFSATLTLSLAPDAPKDKLAENHRTALDFVGTFVPDLSPGTDVASAIAQLAGQDESRQTIFLTPTTLVTVWNTKSSVYTFKVEAVKTGIQ